MLRFAVNPTIFRIIGYFLWHWGRAYRGRVSPFSFYLCPWRCRGLTKWEDSRTQEDSRGNSRNVCSGITEQLLALETQSLSSKALLPLPTLIFCESVPSPQWLSLLTQCVLNGGSHSVREIILLKKEKKIRKKQKTWNSTSSIWKVGQLKCATESMLGEIFI